MGYEELKRRADAQKERIIRAQAKKEGIEAAWKAKYGTTDVEEVKRIRDKAEDELRKVQARIAEKTAEAEAILAKMEAV